MNYTPVHIDGTAPLTPRQKLAQIRKAIELIAEAKAYWPVQNIVGVFDALRTDADALAAEIKRTDAAVFGKATLRPVFVNTATGGTMRAVVFPPNDTFDMPHIDETSWEAMKRILASDGEDIEVQADYDVYAVRRTHILHTIERFQ